MSGEYNDGQLGVLLTNSVHKCHAIHIGHSEIRDHEVDLCLNQRLERLTPSVAVMTSSQPRQEVRSTVLMPLIINDQNAVIHVCVSHHFPLHSRLRQKSPDVCLLGSAEMINEFTRNRHYCLMETDVISGNPQHQKDNVNAFFVFELALSCFSKVRNT